MKKEAKENGQKKKMKLRSCSLLANEFCRGKKELLLLMFVIGDGVGDGILFVS